MTRLLLWIVALSPFLPLACGDSEVSVEEATPTATEAASTTPEPTFDAAAYQAQLDARFQAIESRISEELMRVAGSPSCLTELLSELGLMKEGETPCVRADMDGDRQDEYAVRLFLQDIPDYWFGTVVIFSPASGYGPVFHLGDAFQGQLVDSSFPLPAKPSILGAEDFNGDGRTELAVTSYQCGAHTCHIRLYLVGFTSHGYTLLVRKTAEAPHGVVGAPEVENQIRFEDPNGDGWRDLVFREGAINSVGAGPQRLATATYLWDGERYTFASRAYDHSDLRYFKVRDADDAFALGDYERAINLYQEAINNPELRDVEYFGDPAELLVYARFRIGLSLAALGDTEALANLDAAIVANPQALHGRIAERFRQAYATTSDTAVACASARAFVQENLEALRHVWEYGYANPAFQPDANCPF